MVIVCFGSVSIKLPPVSTQGVKADLLFNGTGKPLFATVSSLIYHEYYAPMGLGCEALIKDEPMTYLTLLPQSHLTLLMKLCCWI